MKMKNVFKHIALLLAGLCISVSCNGNSKASDDIKSDKQSSIKGADSFLLACR